MHAIAAVYTHTKGHWKALTLLHKHTPTALYTYTIRHRQTLQSSIKTCINKHTHASHWVQKQTPTHTYTLIRLCTTNSSGFGHLEDPTHLAEVCLLLLDRTVQSVFHRLHARWSAVLFPERRTLFPSQKSHQMTHNKHEQMGPCVEDADLCTWWFSDGDCQHLGANRG